MDTLAGQVGKSIRRYRMARRLSQEQLSERVDIHYTFLGHIERGNRLPSLNTLCRLAQALRVPISAFLKGISQTVPHLDP